MGCYRWGVTDGVLQMGCYRWGVTDGGVTERRCTEERLRRGLNGPPSSDAVALHCPFKKTLKFSYSCLFLLTPVQCLLFVCSFVLIVFCFCVCFHCFLFVHLFVCLLGEQMKIRGYQRLSSKQR